MKLPDVENLLHHGVRVLRGAVAAAIRNRFMSEFVDIDRPWYRENIAMLHRYKDGEFYTGYLWEVLDRWQPTSEDELIARSMTMGSAYALWDLHSSEKILIPNYWKFPRDAVLNGLASVILTAQDILPKDLYVFDVEFKVCLVLTHECDEKGNDIRLVAFPKER